MHKKNALQRQIPHLDLGDFEKIFPEEYYTKYAPHLKVLQFQKEVIANNDISTHRPSAFVKRTNSTPVLNSAQSSRKIKVNKFDTPRDAIQKNKRQAVRMHSFIKDVQHKIKKGPGKASDSIRNPLIGYGQASSATLAAMTQIENQQYQKVLKTQRQNKNPQNQYVRFSYRNNSSSPSKLSMRFNKSIIAQSAQSRSIKEEPYYSNSLHLHPHPVIVNPRINSQNQQNDQRTRSISYKDRVRQLVDKARSELISLNPQDKKSHVAYIMTVNKSIQQISMLKNEIAQRRRKSPMSKASRQSNRQKDNDKNKVKIDPFQMARNLRQQSQKMQKYNLYDDLVKHQELKNYLTSMIKNL